MAKFPVIIIGAGITGLSLAQALKSRKIDFEIYESDLHAESRGQGWGLAIHWALDVLRSLLPEHLRERLPETYVDPELDEGAGKFPTFRLDSGEILYENLSENRVRVSRERLRTLLMSGLQIKWGKRLSEILEEDYGVKVQFADGWCTSGTFLVGCDGTRSTVRELLCRSKGIVSRNEVLNVRFLGASVILDPELANKLRGLDPLFFQGSHSNDSFMFFGVQDTPINNSREDRNTYACQINISWPYRKGFLGESDPIEIPDTDDGKRSLMRKIAKTWADPFREAVYSIPASSPIKPINIEDRDPSVDRWDNLHGKATLAGDAAHPMTMFRGDAANQSLKDVQQLVESIEEAGSVDHRVVCSSYEEKMIPRTKLSVSASRNACLHAHQHVKINKSSPLISRRADLTDCADASVRGPSL